jgi:hypothetical protein
MLQAALKQDLEEWIVPPWPAKLPVGFGHLKRRAVPAIQEVR